MKMVLLCFAVMVFLASCGDGSTGEEYSAENLDTHINEETGANVLELNGKTNEAERNEQSGGGLAMPAPCEQEVSLSSGAESTPSPDTSPAPEPLPIPFEPVFKHEPIPLEIAEFINGVSFHENAHFGMDFLAYVTITHMNFDGESVSGHLIVAAEIADEVLDIFREIYAADFPIHSVRLIDYFGALDYDSLAANNSSAFNFRYIAGTQTLSRHAFGMAIDINPVQNPYIRDDVVLPEAGRAYLDRGDVRAGMIVRGDVVYTAFRSRGWTWGGDWRRPIDFHHFERR